MGKGRAVALRVAASIPVGGALGYAVCHESFLDLLFIIHGMLMAPLAIVAAGTSRWLVVVLYFAATSMFIGAEGYFVFGGDPTWRLLVLNALVFGLAAAGMGVLRVLARAVTADED